MEMTATRDNAWRALETAPEDEWVLLATTGNHVGEALMLRSEDYSRQEWAWAGVPSQPVNPRLIPLGWQPLPAPITEKVMP